MKIPGWLRCLGVILTFLISAFDIGADWHAASVFLMFNPAWGGTIAYCVITALATLFFFSECFLARVKCVEETDDARTRIRDYFSMGLLVVEDLGCVVVFYVTFYSADCDLFVEVFDITYVHHMALLASMLSCVWKTAVCCKYCFKKCKDGRDWWLRKIVRVVVALFILGLAIGVLYIAQQGTCMRPECQASPHFSRSPRRFNIGECTTVHRPVTEEPPSSSDPEVVFEASSAYDDEDMAMTVHTFNHTTNGTSPDL